MTPPVSENPELRLKDSKGNPLVIAVIDAHTSHWLSPSEVIQAAAIVPDDSRDPVDLALKVSLRRRRDDLFHLDGTPLMKLTPDSYDPATPDRRYSIAKVHGLNIADQTVDVAIMRGELNAVVEASTMSREEGVLLRRNANMHHGRGHRSMGVALAPIDKDGNIIGEFIFEGFVAMGLRKTRRGHCGEQEGLRFVGRGSPVGMGAARSTLVEPGADVGDDLYWLVHHAALFD